MKEGIQKAQEKYLEFNMIKCKLLFFSKSPSGDLGVKESKMFFGTPSFDLIQRIST